MERAYLVLYDIANPRRLTRAADIVLDYGVRVQKSVYEVWLTPQTYRVLRQRLADVIEPEEDGVKIFPMCEACVAQRITLGASLPPLTRSPAWLIL